MPDLATLSDAALVKLQQKADEERLAAKTRAQEVVQEINRRAEEKRLIELAKTISAEDAEKIKALHQSVAPVGIDASAEFGAVGGVQK